MRSYLRFIRVHWALLGFGFLTVFWGNFGQSFFVAWFGADIQQSLGLSASRYGSAYSIATMASAMTVIWAGALIDRIPLQRYASGVAIGLSLATLVLWQAQGLLSLMLGFFLLRLFGQALLPHTGSTTMARYFREGRGKAISVAMSGVPAGEVVLPLTAVALMAVIGWQNTFLVIGLGTLGLIPAMLWLLRRGMPRGPGPDAVAPGQEVSGNDAGGEAGEGGGRREVLTDYRFWLALPGLMAVPFLVTGIFIHQGFIVQSKEWTMNWLATCFILYGVVHWLSSLTAGIMVDRFGAARLLPLLLLPMLGALCVVAFLPGWWSAPLMMALLGMAAGGSPPVSGALWAEIYGTSRLGAIRSMKMAIMVTATAVSPVLFGYFIDAGASLAALFGINALYVLGALVMQCFSYPANPRPVTVRTLKES